jgi:putative mannosyl-glycoprotein endo-beta-N-acetylglucosaminidase
MRQRKTALTAALFFTAVSLLFLPPAVAGGNEAQGFLIVATDTIEQQKPPAVMLQIINTKAPDEDPEAADETAPERDAGLLSPSGLTAAELEAGLLGNLKPYAAAFVEAERETGINAVFLAAVAALESGWNTSAVAENKNNLFGWSAATGYADFESKEDCIAEVAGCIKTLYLSPDGIYFNGYTVEAVNIRYNGNEQWETAVLQIMQDIQRRIGGSGSDE